MPLCITDPEQFNSWLIPLIGPMCDADAGVLAKYIAALLKKTFPTEEMHRKFCVEQLHVFLDSKAGDFVTLLFNVVKNGEYLSKAQQQKPKPAVEAPVAMDVDVSQPQKPEPVAVKPKPAELPKPETAEMKPQPEPVKPKTDEPKVQVKIEMTDSPGSHSRTVEEPSPIPTLIMNRRQNVRSAGPGPAAIRQHNKFHSSGSSSSNESRARRPCRHYNQVGYCLYGDRCKYEHGSDPVVISDRLFEILSISNVKSSSSSTSKPKRSEPFDYEIFETPVCFEVGGRLAEIDEKTSESKADLTELYCHESRKMSKQIAHLWRIVGSFKRAPDDETRELLKKLFDKYDKQHALLKLKLMKIMNRLKDLYTADGNALKRQADEQLDDSLLDRNSKESKMAMDTD